MSTAVLKLAAVACGLDLISPGREIRGLILACGIRLKILTDPRSRIANGDLRPRYGAVRGIGNNAGESCSCYLRMHTNRG